MIKLQNPRIIAGVALFFLLLGVYMLTYRGIPMSGDEVFIFDSMESLYRRGYLERNYEFFRIQPHEIPVPDSNEAPWLRPPQEPLATILGLPLFLLADTLPGVGMLHTVWLYNLFVTALTGVSLYAAGMLLGYSARASWLGALLFGVGTIAWTYSRLLFREPTMMFFVLWLFVLAVYIQQRYQVGFRWQVAALLVVSLVGALLTKVVTLLLLPGLLIVLLPRTDFVRRYWRRLAGLIAAVVGVAVIVVLLMSQTAVGARYALENMDRLSSIDWAYTFESLLGYQISPSRSLWLYSPILLLSLWGGAVLMRRRQWRIVAGVVLSVLIFSAWYGLAYTFDWRGGWSWGPRYLLPLIPVLGLLMLPILERLITERSRGLTGITILLVGAGMFVQVVGMAVPLSNYYTDAFFADVLHPMPEEGFNSADWHWAAGNWTLEWMPIRYHTANIDFSALDFAWSVASRVVFFTLIMAVGLIVLSGWIAVRALYRDTDCLFRVWQSGAYIVGAGLICIGMIGNGLYSIRADSRIILTFEDIYYLIQELAMRSTGDDIIFLEHTAYTPIFQNYHKSSDLVATLPYAPAERYTSEPPEVGLDAPVEEQLTLATTYVLNWSGQHHDRLWFVTESTPFEVNKVRPIERYLVGRYFPFDDFSTSSRARAVGFLAVDAPINNEVERELDVVFSDMVRAVGFDMPSGTVFDGGDILPVSLVWQPVHRIDRDYNIGLYVVGDDGVVYAQRDGLPQATFGRMTTWNTDALYRDNHGLALPSDLPAGEYDLRLAVYYWEDGQRLTINNGGGNTPADDLLLTRISIR